MKGKVKEDLEKSLNVFSEQKGCFITELNVPEDHVHLLVLMPLIVSVSDLAGTLKGRSAIRIFSNLKKKSYWVNHFWSKGYCVDTIGLNEELIRKCVRYQEVKEKRSEQDK